MAKRGLYANIHAKRKRIKAGSGEKMRKPGTKGAPTKKAFKREAKGDRFHSDKAKEYQLKKSFPRAKYMKNKVQAYEMAYIIDKSPLNRTVKDNILKSMWMYAASEGFTVFNTDRTTAFLLSGSYVKCAA